MFIYSYDMNLNAVKNVRCENLDDKVFSISFDTKLGHERFVGTDKKQVIQNAATRMKRACHVR